MGSRAAQVQTTWRAATHQLKGKCGPSLSILRAVEYQLNFLLLTDGSLSLSHSMLLSRAARAQRKRCTLLSASQQVHRTNTEN